MYHTSGNLPKHQYVYVDLAYISEQEGCIPAVWFGICSIPGRMWGCHVLLENGAVYRSVPPHAISFNKDFSPWSCTDAQLWDCYSSEFSVIEYMYLSNLRCTVLPESVNGRYIFTAIPFGEGFSEYPEQSKEFYFIMLDNGRLTIQPTNRVIFTDLSFTVKGDLKLKVSTKVYRCES